MVLDYYHCSEYLYDTAHAQYGKNSQKAQEWVEATLTRLFSNSIEQIIAGIQRMKPSSDSAKEQIEKTIGYLSERTDKVNYGALKRGGYHIGSGGIESSNKFISNVRLKRSGAWWYPTNANNILKLRCAKYNGTFDRIMTEVKRKNKLNYSQKELGKLRLVVDNSWESGNAPVQIGRGRPGKNTRYKTRVNRLFTVSWTQKKQLIKQQAQTDGVFPLLCTDKDLTAKQVLKAYKYQPRLEKRFSQFKTIHNAAPLLFKKIERIEANMFGFFIALVVQALIEREVRNKMKENKIETIRVYPEQREANHPTTNKIIDRFESICTYKIMENSKVVETFKDSLNEDQKLILRLLNIEEHQYWKSAS